MTGHGALMHHGDITVTGRGVLTVTHRRISRRMPRVLLWRQKVLEWALSRVPAAARSTTCTRSLPSRTPRPLSLWQRQCLTAKGRQHSRDWPRTARKEMDATAPGTCDPHATPWTRPRRPHPPATSARDPHTRESDATQMKSSRRLTRARRAITEHAIACLDETRQSRHRGSQSGCNSMSDQ